MEGRRGKDTIRVAIVNDYPLVVAGIATLLADERIDVVETGSLTPVSTDVDIVLYDTFGQVQGDGLVLGGGGAQLLGAVPEPDRGPRFRPRRLQAIPERVEQAGLGILQLALAEL